MRTPAARALALEATGLLQRLHEVADELGTGFDLPALAEMALDDLEGAVDIDRAAIYAGYQGRPAVLVAVRGTERSPWGDPGDPASVLHPAWGRGGPITLHLDRCLTAYPLAAPGRVQMGLLAVDRRADRPFSEAELAAVATVGDDYAPLLDAGLLLSWLRARSGPEEHGRLAHQIHNGIAQELVALGFQVDVLRLGEPGEDPAIRAHLDDLRESINRTVANVRIRISDLQLDARPDGSVGALLLDRLQGVGAYTGLTVRTTLREAGIRPPANVEALVYRLALDVITDATRSPDVTGIDLVFVVDAQSVLLEVCHDGTTTELDAERLAAHPLTHLGAAVQLREPPEGHGVRLTMTYERPADEVPA